MRESVNDRAVEKLMREIANAARILVTGENCSSSAIRMIAMRLMHLGCQVYVVGENIAPSIIRAGDLLIACSESGSTNSVCKIAEKARVTGARIVGVTTQVESLLGKISSIVIKIFPANQDGNKQLHPVSLFEHSILLLFDALFYVMTRNLNESTEMLWALHSNLE